MGDPLGLLALARERFSNRDYYGALLCLDEIAESGRAYADVFHLRGLCLSLIDRDEDALIAFERALALNPRYLEAHVHRGLVLNHLGRVSDAAISFAAAASAEGDPIEGLNAPVAGRLANEHARLGDLYADAGVLEEAVREYRRAAALGPTFLDLRLRLARLLLEAGNPLASKEELDQILQIRPEWLDAQIHLGLAHYLSGDVAGAAVIWRGCHRAHPDSDRVSAYLAMVERIPE